MDDELTGTERAILIAVLIVSFVGLMLTFCEACG